MLARRVLRLASSRQMLVALVSACVAVIVLAPVVRCYGAGEHSQGSIPLSSLPLGIDDSGGTKADADDPPSVDPLATISVSAADPAMIAHAVVHCGSAERLPSTGTRVGSSRAPPG